ncbi:MAG: DeoR/GlpR family DNA-binding transcription regulator [Pseudomonadota bacterium]|nr:DeoR/GlpR family DNA-binding transcription regulator [Pseudomonadota bacterium]
MFDAITERQAQIAERVRQRGFQTVTELADHFAVTTQTIRRDINELSEFGILKRRHGGAEIPVPLDNLGFGERRILNQSAKESIGRTVARYIPNGASLAVSIGTTPEIAVRHLKRHRDLKVFTNSLMAAMGACAAPGAEIHVPGGPVRTGARDVVGREVEEFFDRYKVDIGLYGVGGVDADGQLLDFHEEEIRVREAIRRNSRTVFLVLDATKFGRPAHVRGGRLTDADVIFCDRAPPAPIRAKIAAAGGQLILCEEETLV